MINGDVGLVAVLNYGLTCLKATGNKHILNTPDDKLIEAIIDVGVVDVYCGIVINSIDAGDDIERSGLPYPKLHHDANAVIEVTEDYLSIPLCGTLYATHMLLIVDTHAGHKYLETLLNQSLTVYCTYCNMLHPRTERWFNSSVLTINAESATCLKAPTQSMSLPPPSRLQ